MKYVGFIAQVFSAALLFGHIFAFIVPDQSSIFTRYIVKLRTESLILVIIHEISQSTSSVEVEPGNHMFSNIRTVFDLGLLQRTYL